MRSLCAFGLFAISVAVLAGCGPSGPKTYTVSGTVSLDGTPVSEGNVVFKDAAGQEKSYGGAITGGKYSFECSPGKKEVQIIAMRAVPGEVDTTSNPGEEAPVMEQYIPKQYNEESTLTADVSSSAKTFDFALKSEE